MSELFRKKSLDKISAPEQLDSYMKVVRPSVWMILIAILLLLAGGIIWSLMGTVDTVVSCYVLVNDNGTVIYVPEEEMTLVKTGMTVDVIQDNTIDNDDSISGVIIDIDNVPMTGAELMDEKIYAFGIGSLDRRFCKGEVDMNMGEPPMGLYDGRILVESVRPASFIE